MGKDSELVQAVKAEDIVTVQRIITKLKAKQRKSVSSKKSPLNFQDDVGFSALHHAALNGNCAIIGTLLDNHHYINVDLKDDKGMRPIHYAAWQGRVEPVRLLLQAGADPNEMSIDSETPLHLASQYGSYSVVELLLQYDADPTAKNKQGKTPLDLAAEFGKCGVADLLLKGRYCTVLIASTSHTGVTMNTPLHLAAKNGHSDVIRVLIDAGIDLNRETPNGTALHEAALAGKSEVVKLLIMSGIDVLQKNSHHQTALDIVNKFTPTRAAQDIKQILREAIGGNQAQAIKDYTRIHDRSALSFKSGDIITVLERNPDGRWKGAITRGNTESIGFFPGDYVQLIYQAPPAGLGFPSYANNIHPNGPYQNASRSPSVDNITNHRYSTGSTASAGSTGTWSNRESIEHSTPVRRTSFSQMQQGHDQDGFPPPPQAYQPDGSQGSQDLPPPPPELLQHGGQPTAIVPPSPTSRMNQSIPNSPHYPHSPSGNGGYNYSQFQFPASAGSSPSRQPFHGGRGRPSFDDPPWLRPIRNRPPSGSDFTDDGSTDGHHTLRSQQGLPSHYHLHNSKSLIHTHPAHSLDNMLSADLQHNDFQRPHSDGMSDFRYEAMAAQNEGVKDADRIYEWLRRQRLMEYTNNFTKAGYDMPTIARMTPEDLTAVGITKPSHRKRVTAMIAQMREQDPLPTYIPADVSTWLKLLDLNVYHNTLMTNGFGTIEEVYNLTWEDLQDIGISKLGHQKKLALGVKRLKDLKKRGWLPGQVLNSDSGGSASPQSSVDGLTPLNSAAFHLPMQERGSPSQSPQTEGPPKTMPSRAMRNSQESLGSEHSNRSAGSSQDTTTPVESQPQTIQLRLPPQHRHDASYVPTVAKTSSNGKPPMAPKATPPEVPKRTVENPYSSFSTFKQQTGGPVQQVPQQKTPQGLDRLIGMHKQDQNNRNSVGSASSLGSGSGSGSGDHSSQGSKKSIPPAPPQRTNSVLSTTTLPDEKLRTATIGRKKSMKAYHDRENAVAAGMVRHPEITSGFATIKRTPSRKTDTMLRMKRSQSHENEPLSALGTLPFPESNFKPPAAPSVPKVSQEPRVSQQQPVARVSPSEGQDNNMTDSRVPHMGDPRGLMQSGQYQQSMINANISEMQRALPNHTQQHSDSPNQIQQHRDLQSDTLQQRDSTNHIQQQRASPQRASPKQNHSPRHMEVMRTNSSSSAGSSQGTSASSEQQDSAMHLQNAINHSVQIQQESRQSPKRRESEQVNRNVGQLQHLVLPQSPRRSSEQIRTHQQTIEQMQGVNQRPPGGPYAKEQAQAILSQAMESKQGSTFRNGSIPHSKFQLPGDTSQFSIIGNVRDQGHLAKSRTPPIERSSDNRQSHSFSFVMPPPSTATVYEPSRRQSGGSENSSNSSESSGQQKRPNSNEILWKKQPGSEESPVLQPVLSNPLQGIWRPKSRHQNRNSGTDFDETSAVNEVTSTKTSEDDQPLQTQATFLQLKKQFLNTDSHPLNYQTLKRPPKKPEPLAPEFRCRSRSFTDQDEFQQSPVSKQAPFSFETMNRNMNANSNSEQSEPEAPPLKLEVDVPRGVSSFQRSSPASSPRHMPVNPMQQVQRPVVPYADSQQEPMQMQQPLQQDPRQVTTFSVSQQPPMPGQPLQQYQRPMVPVSVPQPPAMQAPKSPSMVAVPPPPVGPPPSVPASPKNPGTFNQGMALDLQASSPAPTEQYPLSMVSPTLPPPPPPLAPVVMSTVPDEPLPPPPPPAVTQAAIPAAPTPPPPAPAFMGAPAPPPPPPPSDMQLASLKQAKKANAPSLGGGGGDGKGDSNLPKKMPMGLTAGMDMMAELKQKQKKRQKIPVVSETWESNSDTIKRKPTSPTPSSTSSNEDQSSSSSSSPRLEPPATATTVTEPKKKAGPPVVMPKTRLSPRAGRSPEPSPPIIPKPQQSPQISLNPALAMTAGAVSTQGQQHRPGPDQVVQPPKLLPSGNSADVDVFSSEMDALEDADEVVDSDSSESSDTLDSPAGLRAFENENTDTIKKQPQRLSPRRPMAPETMSFGGETRPTYDLDAEILTASSASPVLQPQSGQLSKDIRASQPVPDEDPLDDATSQLEEVLRTMAMEDPLAELVSQDSIIPPPSDYQPIHSLPRNQPPPPPSVHQEPVKSVEPAADESKEVFSDIESMFANLALDLDSMMG